MLIIPPPENERTDEPNPGNNSKSLESAAIHFARQRLGAGATAQQTEKELVEAGFGADLATIVVQNLQAEGISARSQGNRRRFMTVPADTLAPNAPGPAENEAGRRNMLMGALWFFGGLIVTIVTLAAASGGGTYIIAWGAIVFGAIQFFRGYAQAHGK
jgi:hypothetical protein